MRSPQQKLGDPSHPSLTLSPGWKMGDGHLLRCCMAYTL